jgi:ABC-type transport system substrate-binding protein
MRNVLKGLLIASAVLSCCATAIEARPAGTLDYGTRIQLNNWNPLVKPNQTYTALVYEGLVKVAADGHTIQPSLATAWTLSADKIDLTLRSGVVFHDGTPFDANIVKRNIEWIKKSGTQWANGFATIGDVEVKDPTHVTLHLTSPSPTMLQRLASRGAYMVSPKVIDSGSWSKEGGTGPWVYDAAASQLGTREVFRFFDRYWAPDQVGVETIVMHVLQDPSVQLNALVSGLVQVTELDSSQIPAAEAAGMKAKSSPSLVQHILFLDRRQTFADENVRKAICSAADISAIGKAAYNGYAKPVPQKVREGAPGYNPDVKGYSHDLAAAKKYMAAAGNPKLSFTLPMFASNQTATMLLAGQLKQIGIDVKTQLMTSGQYFSYYQSDKYPMQLNSSATEDLGPLDYYAFRFGPKGVGNPFHVDVPELDALAAKALKETDPVAQNKGWQAVIKYINDHALDCGFYEQHSTWAFNPKKMDDAPTTVLRPSALRYDEVRLK